MGNMHVFGLALDRHQSNMLAAFEASESAAEAIADAEDEVGNEIGSNADEIRDVIGCLDESVWVEFSALFASGAAGEAETYLAERITEAIGVRAQIERIRRDNKDREGFLAEALL